MVLVRVSGGSCSAEAILRELARVTPTAWNWEARHHGVDAFIVPFPSQPDGDRLGRFEELHVRNHRVVLQFEQWMAQSNAVFQVPKVWAIVHGVPEDLLDDFDRL